MTERLSFTKYEHEILPQFRNRMSTAESTEDVRKFFCYTVKELLEKILEIKDDPSYDNDELEVTYPDDVDLDVQNPPHFKLGERLLQIPKLKEYMENSDLPDILQRLAEAAIKRYLHLEKHRDRTESKIRDERPY